MRTIFESARSAKQHYRESIGGDYFSRLEELLATDYSLRIPKWLPKVFQHILDDFQSVDELTKTDFLSCLLNLVHRAPDQRHSLNLKNLETCLPELSAWDSELAIEVLAM